MSNVLEICVYFCIDVFMKVWVPKVVNMFMPNILVKILFFKFS